MNAITNFSFGENKRIALLNSFGEQDIIKNDIEKSLNKANLTLKEVKPGVHRWVNPNGDEHAEHGSKATFTHDGKTITGTVGRVSKSSGKYVIKDDEGKEYKKHHHEVTPDKDKKIIYNERSTSDLIDDIKNNKDRKKAFDELAKRTDIDKKKGGISDSDYDNLVDEYGDEEEEEVDWDKFAKKKSTNDLLAYLGKQDADPKGMTAATAQLEKRGIDVKEHLKERFGSFVDNNQDLLQGVLTKKAEEIENKKVKSPDDLKYESEEQEQEAINERFEDFADYVEGVQEGYKKAAIMYGSGGVGKTFTTKQKLLGDPENGGLGLKQYDPEKDSPGEGDYDVYFAEGGQISPAGFWRTMWEHNGKTIVFDDCDDALEEDEIRGWLKGALGSQQSTVSNLKNKSAKDSSGNEIPQQFKFTGKMIFISNLPKAKILSKDLQPIMSRSYAMDMTMNKRQTIGRIKYISTNKKTGELTNMKFDGIKNYTHKEMEEVIDFLDKNKENSFDINARTVETLMGMKKLADKRFGEGNDKAKQNFERKAKEYLEQHLDSEGKDIRKSIEDTCLNYQQTLAFEKLGSLNIAEWFEKSLN